MNYRQIAFLYVLSSLICMSCYTVLKPLPVGEREQYIRRIFDRAMNTNHDLIGVWTNKQDWADYGTHIRKLWFYESGKIELVRAAEVRNSSSRKGDYRLFDDTLVVYFNDSYFLERYVYRIERDILWLNSLREDKSESYSIADYTPLSFHRNEH